MKNSYVITLFIAMVVFSIAMGFYVRNLNKRNQEIILQNETKDLKRKTDSLSRENQKTISDFKTGSKKISEKSTQLIKSLKNEKITIPDTTNDYMRRYIETYRPEH